MTNLPHDETSILLTWGPGEVSASQEMKVEMVDGLAPLLAAIDDDPIALDKPKLTSQIADCKP